MHFCDIFGIVLGLVCIYYFIKKNIGYVILATILVIFDLYTRNVMIFIACMAGLAVIVLGAMIWRDDARKKKEKNDINVKQP